MAKTNLDQLNERLTQARANAPTSFAVDGQGLRVRVKKNGDADFCYRYKTTRTRINRESGEAEEYTALASEPVRVIGAGKVTPAIWDEADAEYAQLRTGRRKGDDPKAKRAKKEAKRKKKGKKQARKEATNNFTVRKCINRYLELISDESDAARYQKSWQATARLLNSVLESGLAHKPAAKLTTAECEALLEEIGRRGLVQCNRTRAAAHAVWNATILDCELNKKDVRNVRLKKNPWAATTKHRERARTHTLKVAERRRLMQGLVTARPSVGRDALHLTLLTMVRRSEAVGARRDEFDLAAGEWTIPAERMKAATPHTVLLSRQAKQLVADVLASHDSDFLFPSPSLKDRAVSHQVPYLFLKRTLQSKTGGSHTIHDLRRTGATYLGEKRDPQTGMPVYPDSVIDRVLAHTREGVVAIYNRARLTEPARLAWQDWADHLDALLDESVRPLEARV